MRKEFPRSLMLCSALAFFLSYFEYYYVALDGIPYREMYHVGFLKIPPYVLFPLVPALAIVAFFPLLDDLLPHRSDWSERNRTLVLACVNFLWSLTLYDGFYYALRSMFPLPTDPLGGFWIRAGEASIIGSVNLLGVLLPTWYFATIPIVVSVYLAYYIS